MEIPSCYAGKILNVDLTQGQIREERLSAEVYRHFVGANGLGVRVLYERMQAGTDPLGPGNILGFVVGGLTGTASPGSGRHMLVTKSPLTGTWAESNSGGTLGPELKSAGYDAVFFTGISSRPVYLDIRDGAAELRDASELWGLDAYETEDRLHESLRDPEVKIACIGPAGESRSLLAGIVSERGRIAARNGVGAVMGSKNLKAVAIRGGACAIRPADPEQFAAALEKFLAIIDTNEFARALSRSGTGNNISFLVAVGDAPLKNWQLSGLDALPTISNLDSGNMDKYKVGSYGCYACPITCGAIIRQGEGRYAIRDEMHRPEYQSLAALGGMLMNDNLESVIKANDLCNRYGIDTVGVGGTIAMAMECYERGLIGREDTDGLDLSWETPTPSSSWWKRSPGGMGSARCWPTGPGRRPRGSARGPSGTPSPSAARAWPTTTRGYPRRSARRTSPTPIPRTTWTARFPACWPRAPRLERTPRCGLPGRARSRCMPSEAVTTSS